MRHELTRRTFIQQAACASAVLASVRGLLPSPGCSCRSMGRSRARCRGPTSCGLRARSAIRVWTCSLPRPARTASRRRKALFKEARVKPRVTNLPVQFAAADEAAYQSGLAQLEDNAKFAAEIGCTRMMAVLSPASNEPRDERRKFIIAGSRRSPGSCRSPASGSGSSSWTLMFRTRAKEPFIWTLPETVALAKEIGPNIGATLDAWHWHHSGGTVADILATDKSRIVHIHVSDAKPQPPEEVRDNQRHMPGEGVIDLVGFFQALKKIGYQDAVSPEPLGRVPEDMTPEDGARLGLETTLADEESRSASARQTPPGSSGL